MAIKSEKSEMPLADALAIGEAFRKLVPVKTYIAGSIRRRCATVGDIDIVAVGPIWPARLDGAELRGGGDVVRTYSFGGAQINVMISRQEYVGATMLYATGSGRFNIMTRSTAKRSGMKLNRYGLWRGEVRVAGHDEHGIFEALGMPYVAPDMRGTAHDRRVVAMARSSSGRDIAYAVSRSEDAWHCECLGWRYRGRCRHVTNVIAVLNGDECDDVRLV